MNKSKVHWFNLCLQRFILDLKVLIFDLKVQSSGLRAQFGCLFSSPRTFRCFLHVEREGLILKCWSFGVDGMFVCLFSSQDLQASPFCWMRRSWLGVFIFEVEGTFMYLYSSFRVNLFSSLLEENGLILKAFLLERESLIWGRVFHFWLILLLLQEWLLLLGRCLGGRLGGKS